MDNVSSYRNKNKNFLNKDNELPDISLTTFKNIFKGVYERPEKRKPINNFI